MKNSLLIIFLFNIPFVSQSQELRGTSQTSAGVVGVSVTSSGVWGTSQSGPGVTGKSVTSSGVWGESQSQTGVTGKSVESVGVWGESQMQTGVTGKSAQNIGVWGESQTQTGVLGKSANAAGVTGESQTQTGVVGKSTKGIGIVGTGGNVGVYGKSENPNGIAIQSDGRMTTKVLEILGGSDIAEHFKVSENKSTIEAGTLMVIDENNAGSVIPSEFANDKKVVGVVSGAGGVKTGMTLRQEGVLEGDAVIAVAGRVYVKANDLSGAIQPGDFLTSSSIKGEAMKVSNFLEAQGAIIGKAMTPIQNGYVLMLISLQ